MILELSNWSQAWDDVTDVLTFGSTEIWLYTLDGVSCLRNIGTNFYYNGKDNGSTVGLVVDQHHQAWITWGKGEV